MTYSSLSIKVYPAAATSAELESYATKSTRLMDWNHRSTDCYPHELAGWAKSHDLPVHYVDNEWVRVPVSAEQLKVFAAEVLGVDEAAYLIGKATEADGIVIIESEEY